MCLHTIKLVDNNSGKEILSRVVLHDDDDRVFERVNKSMVAMLIHTDRGREERMREKSIGMTCDSHCDRERGRGRERDERKKHRNDM